MIVCFTKIKITFTTFNLPFQHRLYDILIFTILYYFDLDETGILIKKIN